MQRWSMIALDTTTETVSEDIEGAQVSPSELEERAERQFELARKAIKGLSKTKCIGEGPITVYASGMANNDPAQPPAGGEADFVAVTIVKKGAE